MWPGVDNFFSTVSYRYGHSEVGDVIFRIDDDGNEIKEGHALLFENFFHPTKALNAGKCVPVIATGSISENEMSRRSMNSQEIVSIVYTRHRASP